MRGYVYKVTNTVTGDFYVGHHKESKSKSFLTYFGQGKVILEDIERYGINAFEKTVLEVLEPYDMKTAMERESFWISKFFDDPKCINQHDGSWGGRGKNQKCTECGQIKSIQAKNGKCMSCLKASVTTPTAFCVKCKTETERYESGGCRSCATKTIAYKLVKTDDGRIELWKGSNCTLKDVSGLLGAKKEQYESATVYQVEGLKAVDFSSLDKSTVIKAVIKNHTVSGWIKISTNSVGVSEEIHCTSDHPWCVKDRGNNVPACELKIGDELITHRNTNNLTVIDTTPVSKVADSYDVDTSTGYFVTGKVLSHNCRTRVVTNVHNKEFEQTMSRGNVSFTTVNLPFAAMECKRDYPEFELNRDNINQFFSEYILPKMETLRDLLIRRLRVVGARTCRGQPFLMGQSVWIDSGYYSTTAYLSQIYPRLAKLEADRADRLINLTKPEINALKKRYNTVLKRLSQGEALCDKKKIGFASEDEKYSVDSPIYQYLGLNNRLKHFLKNGKRCPAISEISNPVLENWLFDLPEEIHRRILKSIKRPHTLKDPQIQRLKHGSLTIGYIGLAECLTALYGEHHGESEKANLYGRLLIQMMRMQCDKWAEDYGLNFSLLQTPAEGLSFNALVKVRKEFGTVVGVSDKNYLTNSSHVPVGYRISAFDKIRIECAPLYDNKTCTMIPGYSALANAGHICYVELEHEPGLNPDAFMEVLRFMHDNDVGYGAVNHPVDRDPACGYIGVI